MTAVLSFDLKRCFSELTKDDRWNVLSVLILHANVRNRCWPGTDILARMATNGNRKHALAAKQWLIEHGAIELVPFAKRVDKERNLPPRQHVYQLTGSLTIANVTYDYLYVGKSSDGETFESIDGETFNGETLSSTNGSKSKEKQSAQKSAGGKPRKRNEMCDAVTEHLFETKLGTNPETEKIAAMTGAWLSGGNAPKNLNIAPLETPLTPTDVVSIARFFRQLHPEAAAMRSITAAVRWTHDWIAAGKPPGINGNGTHPHAAQSTELDKAAAQAEKDYQEAEQYRQSQTQVQLVQGGLL